MAEVGGSEIDGNLRLFGGITPAPPPTDGEVDDGVVSANPFAVDDWPTLDGMLAQRFLLFRICSVGVEVVFGP